MSLIVPPSPQSVLRRAPGGERPAAPALRPCRALSRTPRWWQRKSACVAREAVLQERGIGCGSPGSPRWTVGSVPPPSSVASPERRPRALTSGDAGSPMSPGRLSQARGSRQPRPRPAPDLRAPQRPERWTRCGAGPEERGFPPSDERFRHQQLHLCRPWVRVFPGVSSPARLGSPCAADRRTHRSTTVQGSRSPAAGLMHQNITQLNQLYRDQSRSVMGYPRFDDA